MTIGIQYTLAEANRLAKTFEEIAASVPYERKGVLFSEMLFFLAASAAVKPGRILESGRGRGQSTHLLCLCFPRSQIVSIEGDARSPDVPVAEARLKNFSNVRLLFGDSKRMLPQLAQAGDVVLIDGPKGFSGLRLALKLLRRGRAALVFVHDCPRGSPERIFLDRYIPGVFYSDDAEFVKTYSYLDERCREAGGLDNPMGPNRSYGSTFACIPNEMGFSYGLAILKLGGVGFANHIARSLCKRLSW